MAGAISVACGVLSLRNAAYKSATFALNLLIRAEAALGEITRRSEISFGLSPARNASRYGTSSGRSPASKRENSSRVFTNFCIRRALR